MTTDSTGTTLKPQRASEPKKFGTFTGVFVPSALTIFGVIMYLRIGWVVGNVGIVSTLAIVLMSTAITFLTTLSISATATNMKVAGGGAYFMISRSLGLEFGAAVGIPLFLAQALGISFYLAGFSEAVNNILPDVPPLALSLGALAVLFGLAYKSADIALKSQYVILVLIIGSLVSFFAGSSPSQEVLTEIRVDGPDVAFWDAFAVFFPAVTGILAGVSMSGDLKDPARSLPWGTLTAVLSGLIVYCAIPIFFVAVVDDQGAMKSSRIMEEVALWAPAIWLGVWGATLSSGMGSLLGAPRTLQALARDGVLSNSLRFLGKGSEADDSPRLATIVTLIVAVIGLILGDLNAIAPVLSMFFLTAYGVLNFSAGIEGMIANPAWRPKFRTPWSLSLLGGLACFATMFMIDPGATIIALIISFGVFYYMQRKNLRTNFGDMRRGMLMFLARYSIFRLAELPTNARSWRPNLLVFAGSPSSRWYLVELADAITHGKGFMTVATIAPKGSSVEDRMPETRRMIEDYLRKRAIPSLVTVSVSSNTTDGIVALVRNYGLGPLVPNTIMLGETEQEDNFEMFAEMLIRLYQTRRNIVVVREGAPPPARTGERRVDVWWGRERENAGLSLALGYMLQNSPEWSGATLHLKSITTNPDERDTAFGLLREFLDNGRVPAEAEVYVAEPDKNEIFAKIREVSSTADLVFLGMEPPKLDEFLANKEEYIAKYAAYYRQLLQRTQGFPATAMILSAEDMKFTEIFA